MKILVTVKSAAALDDEFEMLDGAVDPDFVEFEVNEWDAFSLEEAVRIRDEAAGNDNDEVVVVTVGSEEAEEPIRSCLAKGADRAIRVWDESLAGADPLTVARILAAVAEREQPDLVLSGVQSSDAANSATGIALGGYLDLPHVAVVKGMEWNHREGSAVVERELEGGVVERLRVSTPAVLTIQTGINEPRYANLRAIKLAREKPLAVLDPAELGIDAETLASAAGARTIALAKPEKLGEAEMLEGDGDAMATRILEIIEARRQG